MFCWHWVRQENFCDSFNERFRAKHKERERRYAGAAGVVGFNDYLEKASGCDNNGSKSQCVRCVRAAQSQNLESSFGYFAGRAASGHRLKCPRTRRKHFGSHTGNDVSRERATWQS